MGGGFQACLESTVKFAGKKSFKVLAKAAYAETIFPRMMTIQAL